MPWHPWGDSLFPMQHSMRHYSIMYDVTHWCITWLNQMWDDSAFCVTLLIHVCRDSFTCVTTQHSKCNDSLMYDVTLMRDRTQSTVTRHVYAWRAPFTCETTRHSVWRYSSHSCVYGVATIRGLSLKLRVSFAEYRLYYRALVQKKPTILRSLLVVATPYSLMYDLTFMRDANQSSVKRYIYVWCASFTRKTTQLSVTWLHEVYRDYSKVTWLIPV